MALIPHWSVTNGVRTRPSKMPTYMASDPNPDAVARSPTGNQRAATLVTAFRMNGWPTAMPSWATRTRL
jgi:hypothetical protein